MYLLFFFFFKQKTAYEMRISDWSSDVCSSDLCCSSSQLLSLRLKEQQLLAKYHDDSPFVQDVRREISLVNNFLQKAQQEVATRVQTGKNVVYDKIPMAITMAEASQNALKAKKAEISPHLPALDGAVRSEKRMVGTGGGRAGETR